MRLALLSPMPPERNGIADYARHFSEALKAQGVDVVLPLAGARIRSRADARRWVEEADWEGVDIVHTQFGGGRIPEFLALEALVQRRWPAARPLLTATVHDPERLVWRPILPPWRVFEGTSLAKRRALQLLAIVTDPLTLRAERRLAASLDGIVTLTEAGAAALARRLRVPRDDVTVISHGTPTVAVAELPPSEPLRLLYFGFVYRGKGIEDLLDALARVFAVLPGTRGQIRLTLAGGTAPSTAYAASGDYLGELRARVVALGLDPIIDWALDVEECEIAGLVQRHHVMVLPYRESRRLALLGQQRGTSGALAWAVACGRGVITSDARSFAEEIAGGNGIAYPQGNVRELAACISLLVRIPTLAQRWTDAAARLAERRAWPQTALRFEQCFEVWRRSRT